MNWQVRYARTFLKEMANLPSQIRTRVEAIAFGNETQSDPFLSGRTQKLVGYQTHYKIRVCDYRIGVYIDVDLHFVEFQRVLHRRDIYRRFP